MLIKNPTLTSLPVAILSLFFFPPATNAQPAAPQPPNGNVATIRPSDNAYEEMMQAGNASLDDATTPAGKTIADAESGAATLTERRAAVREPSFRMALSQLRDALQKPIQPIYVKRDDVVAFGAPVRRLVRLLAIEQYVLLSDGKVPAAIDSFADSLALSDLAKSWSLTGVLVGQASSRIATKLLSQHLDQLSDADCARLFTLLKQEASAPNPAIAGIRGEVGALRFGYLTFMAEQADAVAAQIAKGDLPPKEAALAQDEMEIIQLRRDPKAWTAFGDAIDVRLRTRSDALAERLQMDALTAQPTESKPVGAVGVERLADLSVGMMWPTPAVENDIQQNDIAARVQLQLLAVHAAILRWRWEHNILPPDLMALNLGALAIDPFTGQPLLYKRTDNTHYTLASAGPSGAKRVPLTL